MLQLKSALNLKITFYKYIFIFLCFLTLGYAVPTIVHSVPYGVDVYTHLFYTREMANTDSLSSFYKNCIDRNYVGFDYPFGLWLFGSIVVKVTGVDLISLSQLLPFVVLIILSFIYYIYAKLFGVSGKWALLSVMLLLSMPKVAITILEYTPVIFVMFFLVLILNFMLTKINLRIISLLVIFIFCLCFTHTGTYLFIMILSIVYFLIYAAIWGNFHKGSYITIVSSIFILTISVSIFPNIHSQYIDKGRFLISTSSFISTILHIPLDIYSNIFYENILVNPNVLYAIFFCSLIYIIGRILLFLNSKFKSLRKTKISMLIIPAVGGLRSLPHSVIYWPIWLGPMHMVLAAMGAIKSNRTALCLLLSVAVVTLPSGYLAEERALREVHYFFVVIPVLAALGLSYVTNTLNLRVTSKVIRAVFCLLLFGVFFLVIVPPVIGNTYYHPLISGANYERMGLRWLSDIGSPNEGCAGSGYGHRLSVYADKIPPEVLTVASGSEMGRFYKDLYSVYYRINSEKYAKDLYAAFGVKYLVVSERTLRSSGGIPGELTVDHNKHFDKIYSSIKYFSIYRYISSPVYRMAVKPQVSFSDSAVIEDAGDSYLVDTNYYKVRIGKTSPEVKYIGNKTTNLLGDGLYYDYLTISWRESLLEREQFNSYVLHELDYSEIILGENQIVYKTVLKDKAENLATLIVKYTFFERAIKREVIVSNDWLTSSSMDVRLSMTYFTPLRFFKLQLDNKHTKNRVIFPCQDSIQIKKFKFNKIFINDGNTGIYIKFEKTSPYPTSVTYKGLLDHPYYTVRIGVEKQLLASESMHVIQWISIGDEETAKSNVERYTSVSLYPYPNGEVPMILIDSMDSLDEIPEESFDAALNMRESLREVGVTDYTAAIYINGVNEGRIHKLMEDGMNIIGKEDFRGNLSIQKEKIKIMKDILQKYGIKVKGVIPRGFQYNLNTVKVLSDEGIRFMISKTILPALDMYFQEGLRLPQAAYYHGEKTGLVLLPASLPTISGPTYFYGKNYEKAWKAVIDSVVENEDLCIFLWSLEDAANPEYSTQVINTTKYAQGKGMTFTTPYEISEHFWLLQNVSAEVTIKDDRREIVVSVYNDNDENVRGVTFKVLAPNSEYITKGCRVVKKVCSPNNCIYYLCTDLAPKERKDMVIKIK